jgi:hypothetical protein
MAAGSVSRPPRDRLRNPVLLPSPQGWRRSPRRDRRSPRGSPGRTRRHTNTRSSSTSYHTTAPPRPPPPAPNPTTRLPHGQRKFLGMLAWIACSDCMGVVAAGSACRRINLNMIIIFSTSLTRHKSTLMIDLWAGGPGPLARRVLARISHQGSWRGRANARRSWLARGRSRFYRQPHVAGRRRDSAPTPDEDPARRCGGLRGRSRFMVRNAG